MTTKCNIKGKDECNTNQYSVETGYIGSGCGTKSDDGGGIGGESSMASGTGVGKGQQRDDANMFVIVMKLEDQPMVYLVGQADKAQEEQ
ncbi:hypothetical protein A2U01_0022364 [Trifolium medium]|uniref:Uncharacterized protein n=1 Tax=Trifolium medium TaxID=97028 RepID=A0A392NQC5_9FABA|nr:hypothetical protein [Trifolium medium]